MYLKILDAATATNGAPSGATAGFSLLKSGNPGKPDQGFAPDVETMVLVGNSTAGSGTMTWAGRIWGYSNTTAQWHPLGTATTDADRGKVNEATTVAEIDTDLIQFSQVLTTLHVFDRVYLETTSIGGTATAFSAWLLARA